MAYANMAASASPTNTVLNLQQFFDYQGALGLQLYVPQNKNQNGTLSPYAGMCEAVFVPAGVTVLQNGVINLVPNTTAYTAPNGQSITPAFVATNGTGSAGRVAINDLSGQQIAPTATQVANVVFMTTKGIGLALASANVTVGDNIVATDGSVAPLDAPASGSAIVGLCGMALESFAASTTVPGLVNIF
ncbi:MAG: hypothetical protein QXL94_00870 [Candidatus Parvarchaeum sp.]